MKRQISIVATLVVLLSCVTADQMYVPMDTITRAPKQAQFVVLLDGAPDDRPFRVIGVISPPVGEYESYAEIVNAARKVAAKNGADAIYLEHTTGITGFRAKAIVWK